MAATTATDLPLPPKDLITEIPQFQFFQDSLRRSGISSFEAVVLSLEGKLINGWLQQHENVHPITLERARTLAKAVVGLLHTAEELGSVPELVRVRYPQSELLVVPADGLVIAAITTDK